MPHLKLDYSANLEAEVDIAALCDVLREAMIETGLFPLAGIRVRAQAVQHYCIADGAAKHGYVDMILRLRAGRPLDARQAAVQHVFAAAKAVLAPVMARRSLALSMEMQDIDPELSLKTGTIRDHLTES